MTRDDPLDGIWRSIQVTAALGKKEAKWKLLGLRAVLSTDTEIRHDTLFELEDLLIVCRDDRLIHDLDPLVHDLHASVIRIRTMEVSAEGVSVQYEKFFQPGQGWFFPESKFPILTLVLSGKTIDHLVDVNSIVTRLNLHGYKSLREFSEERTNLILDYNHFSQVIIIAPIMVKITGNILDSELKSTITCHSSIPAASLRLTYEIVEGHEQKHKQRDIGISSESVSEDSSDMREIEQITSLSVGVEAVRLRLYHEFMGDPIDTIVVNRLPNEKMNPFLSSFRILGSRGNQTADVILRQHLGIQVEGQPRDKDAAQFEMAVHNLFAIQGFTIIWAGKSLGTQGVDLVATSCDSHQMILISATVSNNIRENIRTLMPMWNKWKNSFEDYEVFGVVITSVIRDNILADDFTVARNQGVSIINIDGIKDIMNNIEGKSPEKARADTIDMIRSNIPQIPP